MGGPMLAADQVRWRDQVASGAVIGPRLVVPGPFVDGPIPSGQALSRLLPPTMARKLSIRSNLPERTS